ncbi:hypothetical protein [Agromyces aerolatus]|uniref:hypothetical protein n=1 Tax=Agromyces sp. LY-1074 TaxID=3074080 RepID=UPI00285949AD|nr:MULTISPECIES: hypothetical protein [unclassified Agromyces]MDR5701064.1 hypothetical protein [Agromyces sp. LY-1074]MDR5707704.1 hypothetical protein [Agromyces sp. LY-1358]
MPRFKPLLSWEPFPFLVVLALLLATGFVRPDAPAWLLWPFIALLVAAVAWLAIRFVRERRPSNPDRWGDLTTLDGLTVLEAPGVERTVRTVAPVDDAHRHQPAIDLARSRGGAEQAAVLVPRASRWLSPRYRVGVQLTGGDRPRHAGFLRPDAERRWSSVLDGLRADGEYVRVPAFVTGDARPFGVELDLTGLERFERANAD